MGRWRRSHGGATRHTVRSIGRQRRPLFSRMAGTLHTARWTTVPATRGVVVPATRGMTVPATRGGGGCRMCMSESAKCASAVYCAVHDGEGMRWLRGDRIHERGGGARGEEGQSASPRPRTPRCVVQLYTCTRTAVRWATGPRGVWGSGYANALHQRRCPECYGVLRARRVPDCCARRRPDTHPAAMCARRTLLTFEFDPERPCAHDKYEIYYYVKGLASKGPIFDTRGFAIPLLRGYDRSRAHRDRALAW